MTASFKQRISRLLLSWSNAYDNYLGTVLYMLKRGVVEFDGREFTLLRAPRLTSDNTHGTGCTFASAIAAELAKGASVKEAAQTAKAYVSAAIRGSAGWHLGKGHGPLDHFPAGG